VVLSLGLDAEDSAPLSPRLVDRICTRGEANRLASYPPAPGVDWAKLTFSAKESVYKCYFPLARTVLGFRDVELEFAPDEQRFVAHLARDSAPSAAGVRSFHGRFRVEGDHVITGVTLPGPDPASGTKDP
jgi:4'-phosphopantetheinyl transferase EntD